jgi:hypothetical protein
VLQRAERLFMRTFAQVPVEDKDRVTRAILDSIRKYYDGSTVKFTAKMFLGLCSR